MTAEMSRQPVGFRDGHSCGTATLGGPENRPASHPTLLTHGTERYAAGCRCDFCELAHHHHTQVRAAAPTHRLIGEMRAAGWRFRDIGQPLGWPAWRVQRLMRQDQVRRTTAHRVRALHALVMGTAARPAIPAPRRRYPRVSKYINDAKRSA